MEYYCPRIRSLNMGTTIMKTTSLIKTGTDYIKKTCSIFHSPRFQKPEYSTVLLRNLLISDSWQLSNLTHKFVSIYLFIYSSLHVSSMSCSSSGETNCINTTSGTCHSVLVAVSCAGWG